MITAIVAIVVVLALVATLARDYRHLRRAMAIAERRARRDYGRYHP